MCWYHYLEKGRVVLNTFVQFTFVLFQRKRLSFIEEMKVKDRRETILHKAFEFGHLEQGFLKGREVEVKVTDGSKFYCYRSQGWSRGAITLPAVRDSLSIIV